MYVTNKKFFFFFSQKLEFSAKIKVHRFISCKQGLNLTDKNKENIVQAEQAHCWMDEKYKYCGGGLYESISEGN